MTLAEEVDMWLIGEGDPNEESRRIELMRQEAPIGKSTLRATRRGRYIPGPLLERAIRDVMAKHPVGANSRKVAAG